MGRSKQLIDQISARLAKLVPAIEGLSIPVAEVFHIAQNPDLTPQQIDNYKQFYLGLRELLKTTRAELDAITRLNETLKTSLPRRGTGFVKWLDFCRTLVELDTSVQVIEDVFKTIKPVRPSVPHPSKPH
jgi:hypothetical protein